MCSYVASITSGPGCCGYIESLESLTKPVKQSYNRPLSRSSTTGISFDAVLCNEAKKLPRLSSQNLDFLVSSPSSSAAAARTPYKSSTSTTEDRATSSPKTKLKNAEVIEIGYFNHRDIDSTVAKIYFLYLSPTTYHTPPGCSH